MTDFHAFCSKALGEIRAQRRYRTFTPLRKQATHFPNYRDPEGREVLVWSSNDYLAMGGHPVVVEAACAAARTMGAGAGGTRNISGTSPLHDALEAELAALHGKQAGLLFTSGFVSNQAGIVHRSEQPPERPGPPLAGVLRRPQPRLDDRRHQGFARHLFDLPTQRHGASGGAAAKRPTHRAETDRVRVASIRWTPTSPRSAPSATSRHGMAR